MRSMSSLASAIKRGRFSARAPVAARAARVRSSETPPSAFSAAPKDKASFFLLATSASTSAFASATAAAATDSSRVTVCPVSRTAPATSAANESALALGVADRGAAASAAAGAAGVRGVAAASVDASFSAAPSSALPLFPGDEGSSWTVRFPFPFSFRIKSSFLAHAATSERAASAAASASKARLSNRRASSLAKSVAAQSSAAATAALRSEGACVPFREGYTPHLSGTFPLNEPITPLAFRSATMNEFEVENVPAAPAETVARNASFRRVFFPAFFSSRRNFFRAGLNRASRMRREATEATPRRTASRA
mmetsp:Transcript_5444/g.23048  ORF Transcript_5444/g.23048 Transcript_5444/m.23048 type:complete len:310 (+) Transcript_5444:95-1024(+)